MSGGLQAREVGCRENDEDSDRCLGGDRSAEYRSGLAVCANGGSQPQEVSGTEDQEHTDQRRLHHEHLPIRDDERGDDVDVRPSAVEARDDECNDAQPGHERKSRQDGKDDLADISLRGMGEDDGENQRESKQATYPKGRCEEVDVVGHCGGQLDSGGCRAVAGRAEGRHGESRHEEGRYPESGIAAWGRGTAKSQQRQYRTERADEKGGAPEPSRAPLGLRYDESNRFSKGIEDRHLVDG